MPDVNDLAPLDPAAAKAVPVARRSDRFPLDKHGELVPLDPATAKALPAALRNDGFRLLKRGIYDDPGVDVFLNEAGDFAVLSPPPTMDYERYQPRHQALGLSQYKKVRRVIESRYSKVAGHLAGAASVLEVGAAEGAFLAHLRKRQPQLSLAAIEPDETTRPQRDAIRGLRQFSSLDHAAAAGLKVDIICLFHVFEHLTDPGAWLGSARRLLKAKGKIVIEIPCLDDPLLSLYQSAAYRDFYFQRQHPWVYSGASLRRVLEHHGFSAEIVPYQRYGLENHLGWLSAGKPGGSAELREIFGGCEASYVASLEQRGRTDTVFAIARPSRKARTGNA
jgi:SAM-dependent methyltransferase